MGVDQKRARAAKKLAGRGEHYLKTVPQVAKAHGTAKAKGPPDGRAFRLSARVWLPDLGSNQGPTD